MKYLAPIILCLLSCLANAESLNTPSYEIVIKWKCGEGYVSCDNIEFNVKNKIEGTTNTYIGKSIHSLCVDGVTPCKFQGYEFNTDELNYSLYMRGLIEVVKNNNEVVLSEKGEWHY
ncbi:hypothetical protein [Pseudoalteromonas sp. McH1-42]|uniref:hypothetical protein n=1 Tax=Pseudoalteromonas sp. McH1-42 TaxID=2917752 RepID=UPI001EF3F69B|nr:hypothetical protein [Pseudoalteromonas sp. McH1-42]MCG7564206.1 hypothetical protein [Pseudoalteromonas sp. McH1-42]